MKIAFNNLNVPLGVYGYDNPVLQEIADSGGTILDFPQTDKPYWHYGLHDGALIYLPESSITSWLVKKMPDFTFTFAVPDTSQVMPTPDPGYGVWVRVDAPYKDISVAIKDTDLPGYKAYQKKHILKRLQNWFRSNIDNETSKMMRLREIGQATQQDNDDYLAVALCGENKRQEYKTAKANIETATTLAQIDAIVNSLEWAK